MMFTPLAQRLHAFVPTRPEWNLASKTDQVEDAARADGWYELWQGASEVLEPIFMASPYLGGIMRRKPEWLRELLSEAPEVALAAIYKTIELEIDKLNGTQPYESTQVMRLLRHLKLKIHLLSALCDLCDVWKLEQVLAAITRFADMVSQCALSLAVREQRDQGRIVEFEDKSRGILPGLFILAMGKHGAGELNYSSDIDITFFCDLNCLPLASQVDPQPFVDRLARRVAVILNERTSDGYVFRVDLRLRPDPSSTPTVVSVPYALHYYESVGQNWERAAYIKSRFLAGDEVEAKAFLHALSPFVWRRSLDYPAIADIQAIKRQIHVYKVDERLEAAGANLKLGAGGIREIEFFAQTQQLILGGRDPSLRSRKTLDALDALRRAGHLAPAVAKELKICYVRLRNWEHRVQMIEDEQTHTLSEDETIRQCVAHLSGFTNLSRFDLAVSRTLRTVNGHYGELFSESEPLSSKFGSLVFTGIEDDPETLKTLSRLGFERPDQVSATIRSWHHGRINATRSERGRELFTRLVPRLLEALNETGNPSLAFTRFSGFFSQLNAGVQIQSLFLANPKLFKMVVDIMGYSPRLAHILARYPTSFDAMLDANFFEPLGDELEAIMAAEIERVPNDLESVMNALRRISREQQFRIGMQVFNSRLASEAAGAAYARLADGAIHHLSPLCLSELSAQAGHLGGHVAVIAMGKLGSQEMTARSDLDLMTLYMPDDPSDVSSLKSWSAETYYSRFTQKLIAALSAPTHEGRLYEIDMKLRPTGAKGPVAVSLAAFDNYYAKEADTWEFQALTRARVVWASSHDFADLARLKIETILRSPRPSPHTAKDVIEMRQLMMRERPAKNFWDFKLIAGGQVDCEFVAQYLQLIHAASGGPLRTGTLAALNAMQRAGLAPSAEIEALKEAWRVQQSLAQMMRVSLDVNDDPSLETEAFQRRLARAVHTRRLDTLEKKLVDMRKKARLAFDSLIKA